MRHARLSRRGFSLPELLLAVGILVFSLSVVLAFFINSTTLNDTSRNTTVALSHAQAVLEDIRNADFLTMPTQISSGQWDWDATEIAAEGLSALKNETITTTSSGTGLVTVTVTVSWTDSAGRSRSLTLTTMMGDS